MDGPGINMSLITSVTPPSGGVYMGGRGFSGILPTAVGPQQQGMPGMPPGGIPGGGVAPGWVRDAVLSLRSAVVAQGGSLLGNKPSSDSNKEKEEKDKKQPDHYMALEVKKGADESAIKKSYRKLVLQWHPDKHPANKEEADEKIRLINNAYETLSNPIKRSGYDMMLEALERKRKGVRLETNFIQPRMSIPKEFLLCPLGHPDKFVRIEGDKVLVQSREEAGGVSFDDFFRSAKFSLWWMPEVNNMCRCRAATSVAAGLDPASGLSLNFFMEGKPTTDGQVNAQETDVHLDISEDPRFSYLIAIASPFSPGAFRFEGAFWPGHYLTYRTPADLHMAPLVNEFDDYTDFVLADHGTMYKHMSVHEAIAAPIQTQGGDYMKLSELRADPRIKQYFMTTFGINTPVWTNKEFELFFEAHYDRWDFDRRRSRVRMRSPLQILHDKLERVRGRNQMVQIVLSSGAELAELPVDTVVQIITKLAATSELPELGVATTPAEEDLVKLRVVPALAEGSNLTQTQRHELVSALQRVLIAGVTACASAGVQGPALPTLLALQRVAASVHSAKKEKKGLLAEASKHFMALTGERIKYVPDEVDSACVAEIFITGAIALWAPEDAAKVLHFAKKSLQTKDVDAAEQLFATAAVFVAPHLTQLPVDVIIHAVGAAKITAENGPLLEVAAKAALARLLTLDPTQLLRLSEYLLTCSSNHDFAAKILQRWSQVLELAEMRHNLAIVPKESQDTEHAEKVNAPPKADQVARLLQLVAPSAEEHQTLWQAMSAFLVREASALSDAGRALLEAIFPDGCGPGIPRKEELLKAAGLKKPEPENKAEASNASRSRSPRRTATENNKAEREERSRNGDAGRSERADRRHEPRDARDTQRGARDERSKQGDSSRRDSRSRERYKGKLRSSSQPLQVADGEDEEEECCDEQRQRLFTDMLQRHAARTGKVARPDPKVVSHVTVEQHLSIIRRLDEAEQLLEEAQQRNTALATDVSELEVSTRQLVHDREATARRCKILERDLQASQTELHKLRRLFGAEQATRLALQDALAHKAQELASSHAACEGLASGLGALTTVKDILPGSCEREDLGKYRWCEGGGFVRVA